MYPDPYRKYYLQTDASEWGKGVILSLLDDSEADHQVVYFSRKLLPRKTCYSTVEKEGQIVVDLLKYIEVYLVGQKFTIQMDHSAL